MPSLPLLLLSAAAAASSALADHVLVLGNAPTAQFHASSSSSASSASFSAAGLADLALDSIGLPTGRVSTRPSAVQSPLQADVFTHSQAHALLLLGDASAGALDAVSAALHGAAAFHAVYPSQAASVKVPAAVAQEFQAKHHAGVRCAGSVALCASVEADAPSVAAELVQEVLQANSFLDAADAADVAFARELAQVAQLSAQLKQQTGKTLYVVGVSGLDGDKQKRAQQAVATTVAEFLAQLMKKSETAAAQVMTGKLPAATQQVAALSRRARNRKLVSGLTNEEDEEDEEESDSDSDSDESDSDSEESDSEESDEDEDEEVVDLSARSGSVWDDVGDDNSTSKTNATAPGAVSMPDIAEFQIILWTSVLLGAMLLMAVLAMGNMDTGRDSLLYAKFIADVNGRKTN